MVAKDMNDKQKDDLNIFQLLWLIWSKRRMLIRNVLIFMVVGVLYVLLSADTYVSKTTFVPKVRSNSRTSSRINNLASLAGINLNNSSGSAEIPPQLYRKIVKSTPFKLALLNAQVKPKGMNQAITYKEYYEEYFKPAPISQVKRYTIGLPKLIIKALRPQKENEGNPGSGDSLIRVSADDRRHFQRLNEQISVNFSELEGVVELGITMPEPDIAAQMALFAQDYLQQKVIEYKLIDAREELKFTEELYDLKRSDFEKAMNNLANFQDQNLQLSTAAGSNEQKKLQADFDLAFGVYSDIARQLEQVKLQVSKDTPIFSVIEPVSVPHKPAGRSKIIIIIAFVVFSVVFSLSYIFGKILFSKILDQKDSD